MHKTLYGKDSGSRIRIWTVTTDGPSVCVIAGIMGGKPTVRNYTAKPTNIGRVNELSAAEQAEVEAEAKYTKQLKSGYFKTVEEAMQFVEFTPMKAQDYKDFKHKVVYPCYIQPKLNGQRLMIDAQGQAWSKQGERCSLPKHWVGVKELAISLGGLDGEVFAGVGVLSLQQIRSAFVKTNPNTPKLKFYVYDLPIEGTNKERLTAQVIGVGKKNENVIHVETRKVLDEAAADEYYHMFVAEGNEGACYRNLDGVYEFGKRSYDLLKRKPRPTAEAKVVAVEKDKNKNGVLHCVDVLTGVQFKCLMRKDSHDTINYREYNNALTLIQDSVAIEYAYEEHSDAGVPTKPVGIGVRNINKQGQPLN